MCIRDSIHTHPHPTLRHRTMGRRGAIAYAQAVQARGYRLRTGSADPGPVLSPAHTQGVRVC
eukprot:2146582-Rhodomonas_salina.1